MKIKEWLDKLEALDPDMDVLFFMRDPKRPHLDSGSLKPIKDIDIFKTINQDSNKVFYALEIKEGGE